MASDYTVLKENNCFFVTENSTPNGRRIVYCSPVFTVEEQIVQTAELLSALE
jgi:hypothetical protein